MRRGLSLFILNDSEPPTPMNEKMGARLLRVEFALLAEKKGNIMNCEHGTVGPVSSFVYQNVRSDARVAPFGCLPLVHPYLAGCVPRVLQVNPEISPIFGDGLVLDMSVQVTISTPTTNSSLNRNKRKTKEIEIEKVRSCRISNNRALRLLLRHRPDIKRPCPT